MIETLVTLAAGIAGYVLARSFVSRRLRYVDAIHSPLAPLLAGLLGVAVASPFTFLPLVGLGSAVLFGVGVGWGTAGAARALRRGEAQRRQLPP
jgi:hypothetical protein